MENYEQSDYVITEHKGRYGLSLKDGKEITPCVYDEIRPTGYCFTCRTWRNLDRVEIANGEVSFAFRNGFGSDAPISLDQLKAYDDIPPEKADDDFIIYAAGKFGLKDAEGNWIVPCICDSLSKWNNAEVVEVRVGETYQYLNLQGEEILTDKPAHGDSYTESKFLSDIVEIKELTDGIEDHHTYVHKMGFVRLNCLTPKELAKELKSHCERIPLPKEALTLLMDKYSYEYSAGIVTVSADDCIQKGINLLKGLGFFENSWHYTDKLMTNKNTLLQRQDFIRLRRYYEDKERTLGTSPYFAYGIDTSLKDGEVKWLHVQHYCEHCFPGHYDIGDLVREGSLEELRQAVEKEKWAKGEPYGGDFFHYGNIDYTTKRNWTETKKVLEYIGQHCPDYGELLKDSVFNLRMWTLYSFSKPSKSRFMFYLRCIKWALKKGADPNAEVDDGETCLDKLMALKSNDYPEALFDLIQEAILVLRQHGAMTVKELRQKEDDCTKEKDPYDYSHLNL
jgi:hypothetical protein